MYASSPLLKGVDLIVNARKEAGIINPSTGHFMELDVYLPAFNLAFEYQVYFYSILSFILRKYIYLNRRDIITLNTRPIPIQHSRK